MRLSKLFSAVAVLAVASGAQAALVDLGNGVVLDDQSGLYWLKDANLAKTSGYHTTGLMTWDEATTWAAGLDVAGMEGWRLPSAGESPCFQCGSSEYSQLFAQGIRVPAPALNDPIGNPGPFINLPAHSGYYESVSYWTSTPGGGASTAWIYTFSGPGYWADYLGDNDMNAKGHAWAVRAVPEPAAALLMLAGLAVVGLCRSTGRAASR